LVIHESFGTAGGRIMTLPPPGGKFESNAASTGALMRYPNLGTTQIIDIFHDGTHGVLSGTDGSNPSPSSEESANHRSLVFMDFGQHPVFGKTTRFEDPRRP